MQLVVLTALAYGAIGGPAVVRAQHVDSKLAWVRCAEAEGRHAPAMECATLSVPVDWSDRAGPSITLNLARLPATVPEERRGVVIVLSGGPGASGIDDLPNLADGVPEVRERFDLVAHEPRTAQALRTLPASCRAFPRVVVSLPRSEAEFARVVAPMAEVIETCRSDDESGLIDHLDGRSQALDVEAIRAALGEDRISLTAQSYGGTVVTAYARLHPDRVRAAFVDGTESHPDGWEGSLAGPTGQDPKFDTFADWCASDAACALHGEDVRQVWQTLTDEANRSPIPATTEILGDVEVSGLHLHFLTRGGRQPGRAGWLQLAEDIRLARAGDAAAFAEFAFGNLAVWSRPSSVAMQCPDRNQLSGFAQFREQIERARRTAPLTYGTHLLGIVCGAWPIPVANPPAPLPSGLPPLLGAGTTLDDFAGTSRLMGHIPGSVAIKVEGRGHVVHLSSPGLPANPCVLDHLSRYLIDLELPPSGTSCEPVTPDLDTVN